MNQIPVKIAIDKILKKNRFEGSLLYARWFVILFIIPIFYFISENVGSKSLFFGLFTITVIYNFFISFYLFNSLKKRSRLLNSFFYVDIVLISIFSGLLGGITSDIYIIFFFIIFYYGKSNTIYNTAVISLFTVFMYSGTSIYFENNGMVHFGYWHLLVRDFFIALISYGVHLVINEVKLYDELHRKEFHLARTDKLTGLPNRHCFEQKLAEEVLYADYSGSPINVLMFDLDNFKKFNDSYGHPWGDKLLTLFSDIIRQSIRREDIPVRYGGEEFLILIRDLDINMAKKVGERIRCQLEKQRLYVGEEENRKRVTVSCGLAQYPFHSNDIKEVIDMADKSLYKAKETGKNMVVCFEDDIELKESYQ